MDILLGFIGFIPFLILFLGLTLTKIPSYIVTFASLLLTALFAIFLWNNPLTLLFNSTIEGLLIAILPIIWVIFAAVFTYFLSLETGAMEIIKKFLVNISSDINIQAVIIAFCFGGFLESVAGFGTAVAIPTAMLIALGFNPVKACVISLVANSVPVAFGALGIPVIILSQITALDLTILTKYVALQLLPFSLLIPIAIVVINNNGFKNIKTSIIDAILIGAIFTLTQTLVAFFIGPELIAVLGSLVSLLTFIIIKNITNKNKEKNDYKTILWAIINYLILLLLVIITRIFNLEFLKQFPFTILINIGEHKVKYDWLTTPGTLLFLSAIIGGIIQKLDFKKIGELMLKSIDKIKFSAITILNIVILAKIMGYSGITNSLAFNFAFFSGKFYPFISPVLGALGTFVTGSDTSSNILFGSLQKETAIKIAANPEWLASANTAGATAGKMISPQSISVAASTVGLQNEENKIITTTIFYCLGYVIILGIYVFVVSLFLK